MDAGVAKLAVAQAADGIVFVQPLLGLGGGFDVPFDHPHPQCGGDLAGKLGFACARLALDQQGAL